MSLPPERISVKRRRQEEPVETLILEQGLAHDQKRRFTDYVFQRIRREREPSTTSDHITKSVSLKAVDYQALGIPAIKTSAPGDEINDYARHKAVQKSRAQEADKSVDQSFSLKKPEPTAADTIAKALQSARRFHLTRDIISTLRPNRSGGIRRPKLGLRPPLATFVERYGPHYVHGPGSIHKRPPIDSIVHLSQGSDRGSQDHSPLTDASIQKKTPTNTFLKYSQKPSRHGQSIRDDPSTWDLESDQLANELAALAFEIDPTVEEPPYVDTTTQSKSRPLASDAMVVDSEDDFIFETYIRVRRDNSIAALSSTNHSAGVGILVIDDEDEDLWEKYIQSDDEDDWDEEDEDSNAEDNPRNDYPEDEVSSDDERGLAYKYRRHDSDQEEYDDEDED